MENRCRNCIHIRNRLIRLVCDKYMLHVHPTYSNIVRSDIPDISTGLVVTKSSKSHCVIPPYQIFKPNINK